MNEVNGLPTHILLVHAVVVLLPLAALLVAVTAWWPTLRRKLGVLTPLLTLGATFLVPLTTHYGEWLEGHVPQTDLVEKHAELGDQILPWALALSALSVAVWLWGRHRDAIDESAARPRDRWISIVGGVLAVVVAAGTIVSVIESGRLGSAGDVERQGLDAAVRGQRRVGPAPRDVEPGQPLSCTTSTGHVASRTTALLTDPSSIPRKLPSPREPTTSSAAPRANPVRASAGSSSTSARSTARPSWSASSESATTRAALCVGSSTSSVSDEAEGRPDRTGPRSSAGRAPR